MSRSTYIYVVRDGERRVLGTWTVKREMAAWLDRNGHANPKTSEKLVGVTRHRDGDPSVPPVHLNPRTLEPVL